MADEDGAEQTNEQEKQSAEKKWSSIKKVYVFFFCGGGGAFVWVWGGFLFGGGLFHNKMTQVNSSILEECS